MDLDLIAQIGIFILGISAIILVSLKNKWGFVVGLTSQPFFFITAYLNNQWGLFIASIAYTFSWIFGIYNWFYANKKL